MVKKFGAYLAESVEVNTVFDRNHLQWCSMYPELKIFNLETDYVDDRLVWLYSFNKQLEGINFDLFIEIKKFDSWELAFELSQVAIHEEDSSIEQEKHYEKKAMMMDKFQSEMAKVCKYIKIWNEDIYNELGVYPLVD
jgi:hypothetical protein